MRTVVAPLRGVGVLVTRPKHQAAALCELIRKQGGTAIPFPALEIRPPAQPQKLQQVIGHLQEFNWAVFISANAVERAMQQILAKRSWPRSVRIAVIGQRCAVALQGFGLVADVCPQHQFNSEALLALPEMEAVSGQRIVIFRGNGGRELLADTLRSRGASVEYVEAYRRARPDSDNTELIRRWRRGEVSIVIVNSAETLRNLVEMLGEDGASLLIRTPLLVVSERMLALAEELGFKNAPVVAANATDAAVMDALLAWKQRQAAC